MGGEMRVLGVQLVPEVFDKLPTSALRPGGLPEKSGGSLSNTSGTSCTPSTLILAAHLTVLPPRVLQGSELSAREILEEVCSQVEAFTVTLGDCRNICPLTPTVFIRVAHAAYRMRELHDRLNTGALAFPEDWPYMPHLTIVKMSDEAQAQQAYQVASERWNAFEGSRKIQVSELIFVREENKNRWVDLAGVRWAPVGLRRVNANRTSP